MALSRHDRSYYEATARLTAVREPLRGEERCDVCVVGGGIAGCSTALHLAERGYNVVLLEAHQLGAGASGRSGGQVLVGTAADQAELERLVGHDTARAVWEISVAGVRLVRQLIERHRIACDWASGQMQVAITERHDEDLKGLIGELERYGYSGVRYLGREEVRATVASGRYRSALHDSNGGHLHPLNYTLGLAAAAERSGARVFENSPVIGFSTGPEPRIETAHGRVRCRHLALCGNAYLGSLAPTVKAKIMAVGSCIIATAPLGAERAHDLIKNNAAVCDSSWVLDYFRLTPDHRLIFGGGVTYSGFDPSRIAMTRHRRLVKVFPQLARVPIDYAWGGYLALTRNRAPHFGRLTPNVFFLQGFSGHGLALAGIAGKLLAEAIAGSAERFDVFARITHRDFPGGALLRRPALVLAMLYYRLKDLLG